MDTRSLWLVRHGQASFGKADYDNLSEQGREQAFVLGRDLTARGITPEVVVSGSMRRHRQTVAEIAAGAGWNLQDSAGDETSSLPADDTDVAAAHTPPVVLRQVDERWNELDHRAMLTAYRPAYKNMLLLKADMVRTLRPHAAFEDTFEKAVDRWSSGEHDEDYPESFVQFAARTQEALEDLVQGQRQRVLVVTSAGPVCWTAANLVAAGNLEAWKHFTLAAVNTGVTRITVDRHGPRVLTFNEFTHLEARGLVTNR